jgi:NitT/TauT family transport system substrate-binding protein
LRAEGFERVEYVETAVDVDLVAKGGIDVTFVDAPGLVLAIAEGQPLVGLGGMHGGCFELFGSARVRSVAELRGRTVAVANPGRHAFVAAMVSFVGLNPQKDVKIVLTEDATQQFVDGKVDAVLGFPPEPQEFRARKIGRSIVNTSTDRPWSQYFCCFATGNHPPAAEVARCQELAFFWSHKARGTSGGRRGRSNEGVDVARDSAWEPTAWRAVQRAAWAAVRSG